MAEPVGLVWRELQEQHTREGDFNVAAPLSSTPLPMYRWIVEPAEGFSGWERTVFVMMDESLEGEAPPFRYVSASDPASYEAFARRHFVDPLWQRIGVPVEVAMPPLDGLPQFSLDIHLLLLALGVSGNYANVMPGTPESTGWHVTHLIPEFRQIHTRPDSSSYAGARFGEFGMSLGPQQVLAAGKVVVIVSGPQKRALAGQLLSFSGFSAEFPLSIIHHPEVRDRVAIYIAEDVGITL